MTGHHGIGVKRDGKKKKKSGPSNPDLRRGKKEKKPTLQSKNKKVSKRGKKTEKVRAARSEGGKKKEGCSIGRVGLGTNLRPTAAKRGRQKAVGKKKE